ncbi:cell division protein ZapC [Photorhabdus luminescens]|uniref:Cell division protein ZapC n=1 Tax=Photorhabdus luminescens subsp. mexicana TaxID=2100167 RepID=A0A4R4JGZ8_PHOLU|nr:cell division protein ZapC [Photorhabdus luminescens]MCW7760519.1 cell division protein ZapC [Photorhabdus luminescens subsp. venezuelensis]OWO84213.1 cell division protein ZapC [Photorhabdus luminescens]TDB53464.1 cell division protein ZapC [Photorhabdus luminescens subsp. mexicana]
MNIKPDDQWRWYFDTDHDRVMLDLSNGMVFRSCFPAKMLIPYAMGETSFSVEDATLYYCFEEQTRRINISDESRAELILNALVAFRFIKPQMPRSWYFSRFAMIEKPVQGELIQVRLQDCGTDAVFLVVEAGDSASLCLLAQPQLTLSDRVMNFCDPIKIMNDRLMPFVEPVCMPIYGAAV